MPTIALSGILRNGLTFHGDSIVEKRIFDAFRAIQPEEMPSSMGTGKKYFSWAKSGHSSRWALSTYTDSDQYAMTRNHAVMVGINDAGLGWSPATLHGNVKALVVAILEQHLQTFSPTSSDGDLRFDTTAEHAEFQVLVCGLPCVNHALPDAPSPARWDAMNHALYSVYKELKKIYGPRVGWLGFFGLIDVAMVDAFGHPSLEAATVYATAIRDKCEAMSMQLI